MVLNEKIKKNFFIAIIIFITIFILFNFRVFVTSPVLLIHNFENTDAIVVNQDKYILTGIAYRSRNLFINNKEILLNKDSEFSKAIYLWDNQNNFHIKLISRTGTVFERNIEIHKQ